jgi:hypothetical protein
MPNAGLVLRIGRTPVRGEDVLADHTGKRYVVVSPHACQKELDVGKLPWQWRSR